MPKKNGNNKNYRISKAWSLVYDDSLTRTTFWQIKTCLLEVMTQLMRVPAWNYHIAGDINRENRTWRKGHSTYAGADCHQIRSFFGGLLQLAWISTSLHNMFIMLLLVLPLFSLTWVIPVQRKKKYQYYGCLAHEKNKSCLWGWSTRHFQQGNCWKYCGVNVDWGGLLHTSPRTDLRTVWGLLSAMWCLSSPQRVLADTQFLCTSDAYVRCNLNACQW